MDVLSIIVPCFNERNTLSDCIERLVSLRSPDLQLEIIIVDDCSTDGSGDIAATLCSRYTEVNLETHRINQGKGAALATGFDKAQGDYIAIQDADLEYEPEDLLGLVELLRNDTADVVYGSRFLTSGAHRVLYFWHSMGNRFLTLLSNMMTDLNLTDMETCYKVFKRDIIKNITIEEKRFGFEPEITAKISQLRCRVYEKGISYHGRTYDEGKKIGWKDGVRAIYCIVKYNAFCTPTPIQFFIYAFIGAICALFNLSLFLGFNSAGVATLYAAPLAFGLAAVLNYWLSTKILFKRKAQWTGLTEIAAYTSLVLSVAVIDLLVTLSVIEIGGSITTAKLSATVVAFLLNFLGRKYFVFRLIKPLPWKSSISVSHNDAASQSGTEVPKLKKTENKENITAT